MDYTKAAEMGLFESEAEVMFYLGRPSKPSNRQRNFVELKRLMRNSV
jgi:hypothetical protein